MGNTSQDIYHISFAVDAEAASTTKLEILCFKLEWTYILIYVAGEIVRDTQWGWGE